jgi:hypothetical protein
MDGDCILRCFRETQKIINKHYTPNLPQNVALLESGNYLNERYKQVLLKIYIEFAKLDGNTAASAEVPEDWEWKGRKESVVYLTARIFRKNVHLNPSTANVGTVEFSRAKRKRTFNAKCQASIDAASASVKKRTEDKAINRKLKAHMKAASTTAFVKKVAVDTRIAETNKFVTNLDLLEKYYGSGVYSPEALRTQKIKVFE